MTAGDWQELIILVPRYPVPGAVAGVGSWTAEALSDRLPPLHCLWFLHNNQWHLLALDSKATGKRLQWLGEIGYSGVTRYNPSFWSHSSISCDTLKKPLFLQLSSVTSEDTALCYCVRGTWREHQCEPRHKPPWRIVEHTRNTQDTPRMGPRPRGRYTWWHFLRYCYFQLLFRKKYILILGYTLIMSPWHCLRDRHTDQWNRIWVTLDKNRNCKTSKYRGQAPRQWTEQQFSGYYCPNIGNKSKDRQMELHQTTNFCRSKKIINRMKKQSTGLAKNLQN